MNPIRDEFKRFRTTGKMSPALYREMYRLAAVVFYGKGIKQGELRDDLFSEFVEKRLLRFPDSFYLRLESYTDKQIRSYVAFAIKKTVLDYFRRQSRPLQQEQAEDLLRPETDEPAERLEVSFKGIESLDLAGDAGQHDLPETLREEYKLMARVISGRIWGRFKPEQREVFCLLYNVGQKIQDISEAKGLSLGTVQNYKQRMGEIAFQEAEVREIADLAYQMIALDCCRGGEPCQHSA